MYLVQIYSIILFSFGAASIYLGVNATRKHLRDFKGNILLGLLCFASAIWSYGFGVLFLTSSTEIAYWGRTIGLFGVFAFLFLAQALVGVLGSIPDKLYKYFCAFSALGVVIYFPVASRSSAIYSMSEWGMAYTFKPGLVNDIYTAFSVIYAINMLVSVVFLYKNAKNRRRKVSAHWAGITLVVVFAGMLLDTALPAVGFWAIPGSSISQFLGLLVVYHTIEEINRMRITPMNMSRYIYNSVSEPVMVFSQDGKLTLANNAAVTAGKMELGESYELSEKSDVDITDIFTVDSDYLKFEGKHRTDDTFSVAQHTPVQIQTSKIKDSYGDLIGYITTVKDMTGINEMMTSLEEARKQAEASNLAKSAFLANMSHEIRTPLNAIVGFSELLLKSNLPAEEKEQAEDIRHSSYNLLAVINDILDISKIESGKMELNEVNYSVSDVIKDAYLISSTLAEKKGLTFKMDIDDNIPSRLYGDPVRIRGVLVNILNNAVKYTKEGSVEFRVKKQDISDDRIVLKFEIADTGVGISKADREKLFDSFMRVNKEVNTGIEGTGLGLAIVKGYLDLMNGSVEVDSAIGKGSVFTITIPQKVVDNTPIRNNADNRKGRTDASSISDVKYEGVKVLAVDDNKVNLKVITKILNGYGMDVIAASSGIEAIELCKTNDYDIILMDQMMPVMDGTEAMKYIRTIGGVYSSGECSIIALTANAIGGVKEQLISEGYDHYLSKPINFPVMEEMFTRLIQEKKDKKTSL